MSSENNIASRVLLKDFSHNPEFITEATLNCRLACFEKQVVELKTYDSISFLGGLNIEFLDGEYGQHDIPAGVPAILGSKGIEKVIELSLDETERAGLLGSIESIKADL